MGQAWCKEKSSKAQDSKSPLDRVFVRCAHRIYPGLKEEGSVLGGATQRVTSSEIGYAGSPPRAALLRGQSIDSVDRPFHPSEWVDVNLEVPCTPRPSIQPLGNSAPNSANHYHQQRRSNLPKSNDPKSAKDPSAPVPPPRRRRRRERRSLPAKSAATDGDDSELEPEPFYTQLATPGRTNRSSGNFDNPNRDSDDEFVAMERMLNKRSLESISPAKNSKQGRVTRNARPKNHSTTSLPNVAELLGDDSPTTSQDDAARRPPRHVKTASLPRDASLCPPQTPERIFFSRPIDEDHSTEDTKRRTSVDNSITKIEDSPDCSLRFDSDVETSTPVKAAPRVGDEDQQSGDTDDVFESFKDQSTKSSNLSSSAQEVSANVPNGNVGVVHEVDRPGNADREEVQEARRNEDAGYESRSSGSHLFADGSNESERRRDATDELSSGILKDAIVESSDSEWLENLGDSNASGAVGAAIAVPAVQRTISEESLPHEMLVDELDDEEEEQLDGEKSAKEASNQLVRQTSASENFKTPPPSPELKRRESSSDVIDGPVDPRNLNESKSNVSDGKRLSNSVGGTVGDEGNLTSMTPSLMELEAALTDMLERKDEEERVEAEVVAATTTKVAAVVVVANGTPDKSSDKSVEPQIVPFKRNRSLDDVGDLSKVSQPQQQLQQQDDERTTTAKSRLIDFSRADRTNPFNDFKSDDLDLNLSSEEPPEKPSRLHRSGLIEDESIIDEPLIVPTPPRRRHRSKSNLNTSNDSCEPIHTYGSNDRLI